MRKDIELFHADAQKVAELVVAEGIENIAEALRGRKGGLRPSKPGKNGLHQYLWRMARFDAGHDTSMPVTCIWDLDVWLEQNGLRRTGALLDDRDRQITGLLDNVVELVLVQLGEDPTRGTRRWAKALGYTV